LIGEVMIYIVASLLLSFLIGAIPFSLIAGMRLKGIDLREHGSGNLGATNVFRNLGAFWGVVVLLLDIGKGAFAVIVVQYIHEIFVNTPVIHFDLIIILSAVLAVAGHTASPFAGFKGGKGVATTCGVFLVLALYPTLISLAVFASIMAVTRVVSLASISAACVMPFVALFFQLKSADFSLSIFLFISGLCFLVIFKHRTNLKRLKDGTESKLKAPQKNESDNK
jgi:acyl phosphate:glycerol-3-phosphate acyltransferase